MMIPQKMICMMMTSSVMICLLIRSLNDHHKDRKLKWCRKVSLAKQMVMQRLSVHVNLEKGVDVQKE